MRKAITFVCALIFLSCSNSRNDKRQSRIDALDLQRGEVTLCGGSQNRVGTVSIVAGCSPGVQEDFNLAVALLHSFEYPEAEKVFARVMEKDPDCTMAYWGAAMSIFHPLWEPPSKSELAKGARVVAAGREVTAENPKTREAEYLEAIATIYNNWESLSHTERLSKFEAAAKSVHEKYPDDSEATVFYALALRAAADPADKTFAKQKQAGLLLEGLARSQPDHPGIAHYIIHIYDYPELAHQGLDAARSYARIASASAHAQHMPSHIFTRLGLWDEAVNSNLNSISSAQCYAESEGIKGHWDEELHAMDYVVYAYLQRGDDKSALAQLNNLATITEVYPSTSKVAYSVAAMPARYAVERKDWNAAANLKLASINVDWTKAPWERSNHTFARLLGLVHTKKLPEARELLAELTSAQAELAHAGDSYKANLLAIQASAANAWILFAEGNEHEAVSLMTTVAILEEKTEKHSVTPGELVPARELLGDMYAELGQYANALEAYKANLTRHPNRFNGLYGAAVAANKLGKYDDARAYTETLLAITDPGSERMARIRSAELTSLLK